jgi:glyoxylase-like metal-dependent hydrolase (beta-lactamase superfamily II)
MKTLLTIFISIFFTLFHAISTSAPLVNKLGEGMYNIFEGGYNSLVIISEDDVLVTDTSNSHRAEILKKEIAKLTSNEVNMIALTHEHYDHVGGTDLMLLQTVSLLQRFNR